MADKKIRLRIVTPIRRLFDKEIDMVIMRASTGDMGILYGHEPVTTTLSYGTMRIFDGETELNATVFGGFAEITPECVTILSDSGEWPEEIDVERAMRSKERAEKRLQDASSDVERAQLALRRALVRIDTVSKWKK